VITRHTVELIAVLLTARVGIIAPAAVEAAAIGLTNDGMADASADDLYLRRTRRSARRRS
jgi:hypothetical protein